MDLSKQLSVLFTSHGAVEYEVSMMAPKPAKPSKSLLLELRQLHSPSFATADGYDITHAAAKFADSTSEELNRTLGLDRSGSLPGLGSGSGGCGDDPPAPLYARYCVRCGG